MAHSLTTIAVHLECAIQAEMVVELEFALIKGKQSRRFRHKSIIIMQESWGRVRKCAKVKGHVELKIDKTQSKRPLVTISPNYTVPTLTVSVLTSTYTQI